MAGAGDIPRSFAEITPAFLTRIFRDAGSDAGSVTECRVEPIGEGQGFAGRLARLHLVWDGGEGDPATVVAKLPSQVRRNRATVEILQGYEREVCFFAELAAEAAVRTPRCWCAAMDPDPFLKNRERDRARLERMSVRTLSMLTPLGMLLAGLSRRRYLLLLEDLGRATPGDQVSGAGEAVAERALRELGRLHAGFRGDPRLPSLAWLPAVDAMPRQLEASFHRSVRRRREQLDAVLDERARAAAAWVHENLRAVVARLARGPQTLLHGDFRLDNLLFADDGVWVVDWQTVARGSGASEIAYFVLGSAREEVDEAGERRLVAAYADAHREAGAAPPPDAELWNDYELGKLFTLFLNVAGSDFLELEGRGDTLLDLLWSRTLPRIPDPPWDRLLA